MEQLAGATPDGMLASVITVCSEDGSLFAITAKGLPGGEQADSTLTTLGDYWPPRGVEVVAESGEPIERHFDVDVASPASLARFESDFGLYVAEKLEGYVAIHAALIRLGDAVMICPGTSLAGKSTLAHTAFTAGYPVLSDEYALISLETGMVTGWPRPIRHRESDGSITRIPIPDDWAEYAPTHVFDVRYANQAEALTLEQISSGDVALSLLGNTLCAQSRPEDSLRAVASVARAVAGWRGTRGDATAALEQLVALVAQRR